MNRLLQVPIPTPFVVNVQISEKTVGSAKRPRPRVGAIENAERLVADREAGKVDAAAKWLTTLSTGVRLTAAAYAHGLALARPEKVEMARPTGVGRALATYEIPIEGRDEWLAAARWLA